MPNEKRKVFESDAGAVVVVVDVAVVVVDVAVVDVGGSRFEHRNEAMLTTIMTFGHVVTHKMSDSGGQKKRSDGKSKKTQKDQNGTKNVEPNERKKAIKQKHWMRSVERTNK